MDGQGYYYAPSWRRRLFSRLGFGPAVAPDPEDREGFAEGYVDTTTLVVLDWKDRLRLMLSGRCEVQTKLKTPAPIEQHYCTGAFNVLPPEWVA